MMDIYSALQEMRAYVDDRIRQATNRIFHYTFSTGSSADGNNDSAATFNGTLPDNENSGTSYGTTRMQHFGLRSRPPKGTPVLRLGGWEISGNSVTVAEEDPRYGPSELEEGEMSLYNKVSGTRVFLDKDGNVLIDAASGKDVIVNGGTAKVARVNDKTVADTTMATWIGQVSDVLNAAPGPVLSAPGTVTPPTDFGKINQGAAHFKG